MPPDAPEASTPPADAPADPPLYSTLEAVVTTATPESIAVTLEGLQSRLEGLKGARATQAKKIQIAIELTRELLAHLLQVRENMAEAQTAAGPKSPSTP